MHISTAEDSDQLCLAKEKKPIKKNDKFESKEKIKAAGCGKKINWSTMPVVSRERLKVLASTKELENVM